MFYIYTSFILVLGEGRTLWGECEQAKHYNIDCIVAKALPMKYHITAHRLLIHAWHVAKTRFVTLLSTRVLNSLEKLSWLLRKAFSLGSTTQQSHLSYQHTAILVVAVVG